MATDRQIAANRKNSARSTGPKTDEGKARSRANATKHGLAGESAEIEAAVSPEFLERRAQWGAEFRPVGQAAEWAMDRAVAASLRIERCEHAFDDVVVTGRERARLAWDQDREVEAATIFERLKREPSLASRQLQTSLAGVGRLLDAWMGLGTTLQGGEDWSEPEKSMAMDLLGIALELRSGRTMIDAPEVAEQIAIRKAIVIDEIDRLEALRDEAMGPIDAMDRRMAMKGDIAVLSKPAKLVLRYERDAWRRYREAIREVRDQDKPAASNPMPMPMPSPPVVKRPESVAAQPKSLQEERRALQAEAMPYRQAVTDQLVTMGFTDEDAWVRELERRSEARHATDRSQFGSDAVGPGRSVTAGR